MKTLTFRVTEKDAPKATTLSYYLSKADAFKLLSHLAACAASPSGAYRGICGYVTTTGAITPLSRGRFYFSVGEHYDNTVHLRVPDALILSTITNLLTKIQRGGKTLTFTLSGVKTR